MNILKPEMLWIEGRCYRVNDSNTEIASFVEHDLYENEVNYDNMDSGGDEDDIELIPIDNDRYYTSLHVSKHYLGAIIGKKGAMKCRIEHDTRTEIKIPRQGQAGDIKIFGSNASNIKAAKRRIDIIIMSSRMKQKPTHFISLPMCSSEIINNFENFKNSVLQSCPSRGLDESLFIRPYKLHLTLGVMCLMDNEERLFAAKLLTEAKEKVILPLLREYPEVKIRLKGLSYMNDDPSEVNVLYGCVQEEPASGFLQLIADGLGDHFCKAGYMQREHGENVKLHVTFINSKYRKRMTQTEEDQNLKKTRQNRVTFDASEILRKFIDFDFGTTILKELHLSQMHSTGDDGYYQPTCVIPL